MGSKVCVTVLCYAIFMFLRVLGQNIVDFTYSEYLKNSGGKLDSSATFTIHPHQYLFKDYQFPNACYLTQQLNSGQFDVKIQNIDNDDYVGQLKKDFVELLKTGEKIKHKSASIGQIEEIGKLRVGTIRVVSQEQMKNLHAQEQRLKMIDDQIKNKSTILEDLVRRSIQDSDNNQFIKASIVFDIESYKLKRQYLRELLKDSQKKQSGKIRTNYQKYFMDLRNKFDEENQLVKDLDVILANYNEIGELKQKISSIKNKIDIGGVMLEEKRSCADQIEDIRKLQKNHNEIKTLMSNLREKKKDSGNRDNKYCEGVAIKLKNRIKNVLLSYDYTFQCASGKDLLEQQIKRDKKLLEDAQRRLQDLQNNAGIDQYKDKFKKNRDYIKSKSIELQTFKIDPYSHDPDQIRTLIRKTEADLEQAKNRLNQLSSPSSVNTIDYAYIHQLVDSIKRLKGNYCREYEEYLRMSGQIQAKINKFEANIEYQNKMTDLYLKEKAELDALYRYFEEIRMKIANKMLS